MQVDLIPDSTLVEGVHDWSLAVRDPAGGQVDGLLLSSFVLDLHPPTCPTGLEAAATRARIDLTWIPAVDAMSHLDRYEIDRDGQVVASVPAGGVCVWGDDGGRSRDG